VVYIVDISLHSAAQESQLLQQHADHPHIQATPDMVWRAPVQAPAPLPAPIPLPFLQIELLKTMCQKFIISILFK